MRRSFISSEKYSRLVAGTREALAIGESFIPQPVTTHCENSLIRRGHARTGEISKTLFMRRHFNRSSRLSDSRLFDARRALLFRERYIYIVLPTCERTFSIERYGARILHVERLSSICANDFSPTVGSSWQPRIITASQQTAINSRSIREKSRKWGA